MAGAARLEGSRPAAPAYTVLRRDWAELPTGRFLFASDPHVRLARPDHARWTPRMLVHEALPREGAEPLDAVVEHRFATSLEGFRAKEERYALLWALQAQAEGRRGEVAGAPGARARAPARALQGRAPARRAPGAPLAWGFGRYHARKYQLLAELRAGAHPELTPALEEGRLEELFRSLP